MNKLNTKHRNLYTVLNLQWCKKQKHFSMIFAHKVEIILWRKNFIVLCEKLGKHLLFFSISFA
jgi:hypothetical protein